MLRKRFDWIVLAMSLLLTSASVVTGQVLPNPYDSIGVGVIDHLEEKDARVAAAAG